MNVVIWFKLTITSLSIDGQATASWFFIWYHAWYYWSWYLNVRCYYFDHQMSYLVRDTVVVYFCLFLCLHLILTIYYPISYVICCLYSFLSWLGSDQIYGCCCYFVDSFVDDIILVLQWLFWVWMSTLSHHTGTLLIVMSASYYYYIPTCL
jgi:hypothetical protein